MPAESGSCGQIILDDASRVIEANAYAARLLGYPREELVGKPISELCSVAGRAFLYMHVFPVLAGRGEIDEVYLSLRARGGEEIPLLLRGIRRDLGGRPVNEFALLPMRRRRLVEDDIQEARRDADVAQRGEKQARAQVRAIEDQLALRERLASIGTLAAGVAHEINNPLAFVAGNLELLAAALASSDGATRDAARLAELVAEAAEGASRIGAIVQSLRTLSRVDTERRVPVDLGRVVRSAVRIVGAELRSKARVELDVADPAPVVDGDDGQLVQIVLNLAVNAGQSFPRDRPDGNVVRLRAASDGDSAILEVSDNGIGIPPEIRARIFDPFFTTKPVGEGTGLGLWVCHGIVTAYGGSFEVDTRVGEGTTFRIRLPASRGRPDTPTPVRGSAPTADSAATPAAPTRVLVVDDEEHVARMLKRILRGFDVTLCTSGQDAIARLEKGERYDAVLTDLTMPDVDGIAVYEAIARIEPSSAERVVFMTGGAFTERAQAFLDSVPNRQVTKPFALAELRATLEEVARRRG